jgi:hypothetical protein
LEAAAWRAAAMLGLPSWGDAGQGAPWEAGALLAAASDDAGTSPLLLPEATTVAHACAALAPGNVGYWSIGARTRADLLQLVVAVASRLRASGMSGEVELAPAVRAAVSLHFGGIAAADVLPQLTTDKGVATLLRTAREDTELAGGWSAGRTPGEADPGRLVVQAAALLAAAGAGSDTDARYDTRSSNLDGSASALCGAAPVSFAVAALATVPMLSDAAAYTAWAEVFAPSYGDLGAFLAGATSAAAAAAAGLRFVEGPRGVFVRVPGADDARELDLFRAADKRDPYTTAAVLAAMLTFSDASSPADALQAAKIQLLSTLDADDVTYNTADAAEGDGMGTRHGLAGPVQYDMRDGNPLVPASGAAKDVGFLFRVLALLPLSLRGFAGAGLILPILIDEMQLSAADVEAAAAAMGGEHTGTSSHAWPGAHGGGAWAQLAMEPQRAPDVRAALVAALAYARSQGARRPAFDALINRLLVPQAARRRNAAAAFTASSAAFDALINRLLVPQAARRRNAAAAFTASSAAGTGGDDADIMVAGTALPPPGGGSEGKDDGDASMQLPLPRVPAPRSGSSSGADTASAAAGAIAPDSLAPPGAMGDDAFPASLAEARAQVQALRDEWLACRDTAAMAHRVAVKATQRLAGELYADASHVLFELLQNADDNEYEAGAQPQLDFQLTHRRSGAGGNSGRAAVLAVRNNELAAPKWRQATSARKASAGRACLP